MDLAIVTSCFNYGRYLDAWARSILALDRPPAMVAIVDNGSTDGTAEDVARAAALLQEGGLEVRTKRLERVNFGAARNAAVALADGDWVMHLDADDMVMPHCLTDVAELAPQADVVALGYERCGNLAAGPKNRTRVYRDSQGRGTLRSKAPASGVSPFRRSFWERAPYREDMEGGWDTALWIGFAHLGARFKATRRPCFFYRQHADSIFNSRRVSSRKSARVGTKLTLLRRKVRGVSVIVPWRTDHGPRQDAWNWIRRRYERLHPGWQIIEGHCPAEWRKGVAIEDGLSRATGETLVLADADCVVSPDALQEAVELAADVPWVVPHTLVKRLNAWSTDETLAGDPAETTPGGELCRKAYEGFPGGGIVVVDRAKYEATGGMPKSFRGWGAEDEALACILDTLVGPHHRLPFDLWHFWHPAAPGRTSRAYQDNRALYRRLASARGDPDRMWALLTDEGSLGGLGPMVSIRVGKNFRRGRETFPEGALVLATEQEARRYAVRKKIIAQRVR